MVISNALEVHKAKERSKHRATRGEDIDPRVDIAFKKLFGTIKNKDLLISFINSVVRPEDKVADIEVVNPYNERDFAKDKLSVMDIKAKNEKGQYYNVEIQITHERNYEERALYYWAKMFASQLKKKGQYGDLKRAIGIHILNYSDLKGGLKDESEYFNHYEMRNTKSLRPYFQHIQMYTIELLKFETCANEDLQHLLSKVKTSLDRWVAFLVRANQLDKDALPEELDDENIKSALEVLDTMRFTDEERDTYEDHLKLLMLQESALLQSFDEGEAKGRAEGEAKGKADIIKTLLQLYSVEEVAKMTKLNVDEVIALRDK